MDRAIPDPEAGGAPGALGGSPVRVVSCVRHRSASALQRWLRAGFALLTWDPEPETPLACWISGVPACPSIASERIFFFF
ncbi:hypothetical protein NDU88_007656 [Pleurodeles waltl]|uniref:Uncharacterized protein n=1 Tax=Pleurodeles waltl TaxID=8319 RepID=A0AAV7QMH3_PLEWA|nr:hypothetical protein NDU88_007656 [Pleurodeles waltl]